MGLDLPMVTPGVMKEVGEVEVCSIHYFHDHVEKISVIRELSVLLISLTVRTTGLNCTFSCHWGDTSLNLLYLERCM